VIRICSPFYPLLLLVLATLLLSGLAWQWLVHPEQDGLHHYDRTIWLLIGFLLVALFSVGTLMAFTFFHVSGC
jgi:heme/copper-type cytochrome/quinol oxidase subunit 3